MRTQSRCESDCHLDQAEHVRGDGEFGQAGHHQPRLRQQGEAAVSEGHLADVAGRDLTYKLVMRVCRSCLYAHLHSAHQSHSTQSEILHLV